MSSSKKLSEIAHLKQWKNIPISKLYDSGFPVYGANGIIGHYNEYNHKEPTIAITCRGATCGNIHITLPKSYISSNAMALDDLNTQECDINFLAQYLRFRGLDDVITGAAQPQITRTNLERVLIPLPSLDKQIRIATLLNRVETLITARKDNLHLLDELLKSTFIEMFGDPVRNDKGWDIDGCHKVVVDIKSGTSYGGDDRSTLKDHEMGVLKISAVTKGYFNEKEIKAVSLDNIKKQVITVKKGDFLFSRANTIELVAACCVVDKDYDRLFLPDKLWKLSFDEDRINPQFFNYLLKNESFRNYVRKQASGGHQSMLNISMAKFRRLKVVVPDKTLQIKFSSMVKKVEIIRTKHKNNLAELENLYGSLSQKAFKGELDVSRVPIHHEIRVHSAVISIDSSPVVLKVEGKNVELDLAWFKEIIKQKLSPEFTIENLKNTIGEKSFEFAKIKEHFQNCLYGKKPFLKQIFDNQKDVERIVFRVNG